MKGRTGRCLKCGRKDSIQPICERSGEADQPEPRGAELEIKHKRPIPDFNDPGAQGLELLESSGPIFCEAEAFGIDRFQSTKFSNIKRP